MTLLRHSIAIALLLPVLGALTTTVASAQNQIPATSTEPVTPEPAPRYQVAVVAATPTAEMSAIATFIGDTLHQALGADPRFAVADRAAVAHARAAHAHAAEELTFAQACLIGREVDMRSVLLIGGYDLEERAHTPEGMPIRTRQQTGTLLQQSRPGLPSAVSPDQKRFARIGANLLVVDTDTCAAGESALIGAEHESPADEASVALAGAKKDFDGALREGLRKLFPVRTSIAHSTGLAGTMTAGKSHGVNPGQYYEVIRDQRLIGHAYVESVAATTANVELVRGAETFAVGDRLAEHGTVRVWEIGVSAAPTVLERNRADDRFGVAFGIEASMYQPVDSNIYRVMVETLRLSHMNRWRLGVELGRQYRLIPRRLFAYGRLGIGLVWAHQDLQDENGRIIDGATGRSLEILNAVGLKLTIGHGLTFHLNAGYPIIVPEPTWSLDSDHRMDASPETLSYNQSHTNLPNITISAGWRFP